MKKIKQYYPAENPLAKTQLVRAYVKKDGTVVQAHFSKPKFRKGVVVGYK